jgi:hypothetical protein
METPEHMLALANEIMEESHPPETRIARLASYLKETLEAMGISPQKTAKVDAIMHLNCLCEDVNGRKCNGCGLKFKHLYDCPGCGRPKWCEQ